MVILPKREQQPFSQYMANEIDKGDDEQIVENDLSQLDDNTDWKAKAEEIEQKRREDGIRARERTKALKAQLAAIKPEPTKTEPKKESSELDYGQKAFLKASGYQSAEEMQKAFEYAKRNNLTLDEVVGDEIFNQRLEKDRTTKANEIAAQGSTGRGTQGASGKNSVDYWLAKGEHPPKELGKKLAEEYVEARREKGRHSKQFYND